MALPSDIVKAIAEAEGFGGTVNELYSLSNKKTASVANDLEFAIECLVEAINNQFDADGSHRKASQ